MKRCNYRAAGAAAAIGVMALLAGCFGETDNDYQPGIAPYSIEGSIQEAGVALAGVTVHFDGPNAPGPVLTDASGQFKQTHFPEGTYTVRPQDGVHDFFYNDQLTFPSIYLTGERSGVAFEAVPLGARVDLLSPNGGGDAFFRNASVTITLRAKGAPGTQVLLECSYDDGTSWPDSVTHDLDQLPVDENTWREYSFPWIPSETTTDARIRVTSATYAVLTDMSDGTFEVTESASVSGRITYEGAGLSSILVQFFETGDLKYSTRTDGLGEYVLGGMQEATYTIIPADSTYSFTPPSRTVPVFPGDALTGYDFTAAPSGASITITSPFDLEAFYGGDRFDVAFATTGLALLSSVTVEYDSGSGYSPVGAPYSIAVDGPQVFSHADLVAPPGENASGLKIRITSTAWAIVSDEHDVGFRTYDLTEITGNITYDSNPLAGVSLLVTGPHAPAGQTTDAVGSFSLAGIQPGRFSVTPALSGYVFFPTSKTYDVTEGSPVSLCDFAATVVGRALTITGPAEVAEFYTNASFGVSFSTTGLAGTDVTVEYDDGGGYTAIGIHSVGADGLQNFSNASLITPGSPDTQGLRIRITSASWPTIVDEHSIGFSTYQLTTIDGTVLYSAAPLSGVSMYINGPNAPAAVVTDGAGFYSFSGIQPGEFTVTPALTGYIFIETSETITVAEGVPEDGWDFAATVVGRAVTVTGPVESAELYVNTPFNVTFSTTGLFGTDVTIEYDDGGGAYAAIGTHTVITDGPQTFSHALLRTPLAPNTPNLKIRITSVPWPSIVDEHAIGFSTYDLTTIEGTVRYSGSALSGVAMKVTGVNAPPGDQITDIAGTFTFTGIQPGEFTVTPALTGYIFTPTSRTFSVSESTPYTGCDFTSDIVGKAMTITGPVNGAKYYINDTFNVTFTTTGLIGTDVRIEYDNGTGYVVVESNYSIGADGPHTFVDGLLVTPGASGTTGLSIRLTSVTWPTIVDEHTTGFGTYALTTIAGLVEYGASQLSGVSLAVVGPNAPPSTTTAGAGTFLFSDIQPGQFTVTPSLAGYMFTPTSRTFSVTEGSPFTGCDFASDVVGKAVTVTGPVDGAEFYTDSTFDVTFTTTGLIGTDVSIEYDDGTGFAVIDGNVTIVTDGPQVFSDGSLVTPSVANTQGLAIRIASVSWPTIEDEHSTGFSTYELTTIAGTVTYNASALVGVTMMVTGPNSPIDEVTGAGGFLFTGIQPGLFTVTPALTGYVFTPTSWSGTVTEGEEENGLSFTATVVGRAVTVTGPVDGAEFYTNETFNVTFTTTALAGTDVSVEYDNGVGSYAVIDSNYTIATDGPQVFSHASLVTPAGADTQGLKIKITSVDWPSIEDEHATGFSTYGLTTIDGSVEYLIGLDGVTMMVSGPNAPPSETTVGGGTYTFTSIQPGRFTVTPAMVGYVFNPTNATFTVVENTPFTVPIFTASVIGRAMTVTGPVDGAEFYTDTSFDVRFNTTGLFATDVQVEYDSGSGYAVAGNHTVATDGPQVFNHASLVTPSIADQQGLKIKISSISWPSIEDEHTAGFSTYNLTTIDGTVTYIASTVSGVTMTVTGPNAPSDEITDGAGDFMFAGIQPGLFTVTPALANYVFSPTNRTFTVVEGMAISNCDFAATVIGRALTITSPVDGAEFYEDAPFNVTFTTTGLSGTDVDVEYDDGGGGGYGAIGTHTVATDGPQVFVNAALRTPDVSNRQNLRIRLTSADWPSIQDAHAVGFSTYNLTTIEGSVTYLAGALSGVTMLVTGPNNQGSVSTDVSGDFSFPDIQPGEFTVTPALSGYVFTPTSRTFTVAEGNSETGVDFVATVVGRAITVTGPVDGAEFFTSTSFDVTFTTTGLGGTDVTVEYDNGGGSYAAIGTHSVLLDGPQTFSHAALLTPASANTPGLRIRLTSVDWASVSHEHTSGFSTYDLTTIDGRITYMASALPGVSVSVTGTNAPGLETTDGTGDFVFTGIQPGQFTVTPAAPGFIFAPTSRTFSVTESTPYTGCDFTAAVVGRAVTVTGPVDGAKFYTDETFNVTFTTTGLAGTDVQIEYDDGGGYAVIGTHNVATDGPRTFSDIALVTPSLADASDLKIRITSLTWPSIVSEHTTGFGTYALTTIEGTATGPQGALAGVDVTLSGPNAPTNEATNASGFYQFSGIRPGTFTIMPTYAGHIFTPASRQIVITEGSAATNQDFSAMPAGAGLTVTYPNGNEVLYEGETVTVTAAAAVLDGYTVDFHADLDLNPDYETVIATGVAVVANGASASWTVPIIGVPPEFAAARIRVQQTDVGVSDESDAEFTVSLRFSLSGLVTTDGSDGVEDARVVFSGLSAPGPVLTAADGTWTQTGFRYDTNYTVSVGPPSVDFAHTATDPAVVLDEFRVLVRDTNGDGDFAETNEDTYYDLNAGSTSAMPTTYVTPRLAGDVIGIHFLAAPAGNTITVVHPKGSVVSTETDIWIKGYDSKTIEWTATGTDTGTEVDIGFSSDAGISYNAALLFDDVANDGLQDWVVGTNASVSYAARVRIIDTTYRLARGESPDPFVLAGSGNLEVETRQLDGNACPDVLVGLETAGFAAYVEPQVDPLRPFLTSGDPAIDSGTFGLGLYRLTPNVLGVKFDPEQASAVVTDGTALTDIFSVVPNSDAWTPTSIATGTVGLDASSLSPRSGHTALWTGSQMVVWGGRDGSVALGDGGVWTPGPGGGSWTSITTLNAPSPRSKHLGVWTGSQLIIWGGDSGGKRNDGSVWTPGPDGGSWKPITTNQAPSARDEHTGVWTGSQLVVWGGSTDTVKASDGGLWTPGANGGTWLDLSSTTIAARTEHSAIWTGSCMVVWGGKDNVGITLGDGAIWRPDSGGGSWETIDPGNAPTARSLHTAVWTGSKMLIYGGGADLVSLVGDGGIWVHDDSDGTWNPNGLADSSGTFLGRASHSAVWTGTNMVVFGGFRIPGGIQGDGGIWTDDGDDGSWEALSLLGSVRSNHSAVWTGSEMVVYGGGDAGGYATQGLIWREAGVGGTWQDTAVDEVARARVNHSTICTGSQMVIWGGDGNPGGASARGGVWTPGADGGTWRATSMTSPPQARTNHTAVWTGSKMIVWGGMVSFFGYFNTGGIWTPGPGGGSWTALSLSNVPEGREHHTAVWTGDKMVVWGGYNDTNNYLRDGGIWEDTGGGGTWTLMPTVGDMPSGRRFHTVVWTGTEMVVWGGQNAANGSLDDGGIWQDSGGVGTWTAGGVSATDAPEPRHNHTAVWTGSEMIIWGGFNDHLSSEDQVLDNGGIWTPGGNGSWQEVPLSGSPSKRCLHAAAWVAERMVVWGGSGDITLDTGDIFDPNAAGDAWTKVTQAGAPSRRTDPSGVSIGAQMVIWGGSYSGGLDTGGVFDVPGKSVTAIRSVNAASLPKATVMLSGRRVLMIADEQPRTRVYCAPNATIDVHNNPTATASPTSAIYPDYWLLPDMATTGLPEGIVGAMSAYLTGTLAPDQTGACVWGGATAYAELVNTGSFFNETTMSWHAMNDIDANTPEARIRHTCVALGERMFVWGGRGVSGMLNNGAIYDRSSDSWETLAVDSPQPSARTGHVAVGDGAGNIYVFGGITANGAAADGGVYVDDSGWSTDDLDATGVLSPRADAFIFWSEAATDRLIIWGGHDADGTPLCDGATYAASTWTALPSLNAPPQGYGRQACIAPDGHLLVYGGVVESLNGGLVQAINGGLLYDPNLYEYDPDAGVWLTPEHIGNSCRPHLDFSLFHTGVGPSNNLLMIGGFVGHEPVSGFIW